MEIKYNNLYTHFVFTTQDRFPCINPKHRERIEKYITGIVNNHDCRMYAIFILNTFTSFRGSQKKISKT
jgi:REP element-mobilizing transposase RayT